jgi:hypothetical protein
VLNLIMLVVGTSLLTRHIPAGSQATAARAALSLLVFVSVVYFLFRRVRLRWGWLIIIPIGLGAGVAWLLTRQAWIETGAEWILVLVWLALGALAALLPVLKAFQGNRPGARRVGWSTFALSIVGLGYFYFVREAVDPGIAVLNVLEVLGLLLQVTWFAFGLGLLGVILLGLLAKGGFSTEARGPVARALFTARFSLALPTILFSVATLLVWGGLVAAESGVAFGNTRRYDPVLPDSAYHLLNARVTDDSTVLADSLSRAPADTVIRRQLDELRSPKNFVRTFWGPADTILGVASTALVAATLLLVVTVLFPVIQTERRSPPTPTPDTNRDAFKGESIRLGMWLSFAFRASRYGGELLLVACMFFFVGLFFASPLLSWMLPDGWIEAITRYGFGLSPTNYGAMFASGAGTLTALTLLGKLSKFGLGLRPVLGIAIDVDNYLRELPRQRTPRARMAERYTSLLRYICKWRGDATSETSGYDELVIIAHSQGTVITADLLRFLKQESESAYPAAFEPDLDRLTKGTPKPLSITMLTMGSPLRQLYALRFPRLYDWVGYDGATGPDLSCLLGVHTWYNEYRSGDYVGRSIWRDDDQNAETFHPLVLEKRTVESTPRKRETHEEECIGPGAHTHYWDETADRIAFRLDSVLLAVAIEGDKPPKRSEGNGEGEHKQSN